ncbi:AbrB family transcriptional regulator [Frigidibacter sp. MR17.14]|uniref:AbrB family transcriptional regulator n=1 Tax=Frigidibacter sp. MR17.14 TaxID=3126509 RepID=UPI003012DA8A
MRRFLAAAVTLAAATSVGWACARTGVPLGWLLGAMLVMIAASLLRLPARQPVLLMPWVKGAVGAMLGAAIPSGLLAALGQWGGSLAIMAALMVASGMVNYRLLQRAFGFPKADAALCAMPGGISEMVLFGEQAGADQARVAIVHALRIALSILLIPVIAGWVFGVEVRKSGTLAPVIMTVPDWIWFAACVGAGVVAQRWRALPAPLILVPLALSATVHLTGLSHFHVPGYVSGLVQVMIGINVGARFIGVTPRALAGVATAAASVIGVQMGLAILAAVVLSRVSNWDALALTLAYAPGGLAEMSLIAITMGREVAFVVFHHILRVLFALIFAPVVLRRLA